MNDPTCEATLTTNDIGRRLGMQVSVKALKAAGCSPLYETRMGTYWRARDFPIICHALARHIEKVGESSAKEIQHERWPGAPA